jgi:hypothetical protein
MAHALRVEYPGAFYHVINRGNAGDDIFKSLRNREKFRLLTICPISIKVRMFEIVDCSGQLLLILSHQGVHCDFLGTFKLDS